MAIVIPPKNIYSPVENNKVANNKITAIDYAETRILYESESVLDFSLDQFVENEVARIFGTVTYITLEPTYDEIPSITEEGPVRYELDRLTPGRLSITYTINIENNEIYDLDSIETDIRIKYRAGKNETGYDDTHPVFGSSVTDIIEKSGHFSYEEEEHIFYSDYGVRTPIPVTLSKFGAEEKYGNHIRCKIRLPLVIETDNVVVGDKAKLVAIEGISFNIYAKRVNYNNTTAKTYPANSTDTQFSLENEILLSNETGYTDSGVTTPISEKISENIINTYQDGREIIKMRVSVDDYYDTDNVKVISRGGNKMLFEMYDVVIPYRSLNGQLIPISQKKNGTAKEFIVVGNSLSKVGVVWQELTLIEKTR